jgi:hypothetical protein
MKKTVILLFVAVMQLLSAQSSTAALSGTVADAQSAAAQGARVTITDRARGLSRTALCNAEGYFVFPQLAPATYELQVEKNGFAKARVESLVLAANDQRSIRLTLTVSQREDAVTITSDAPLVAESPAVATVVGRQFIENQPLNGRSFQTLINLSPGVVMTPASIVDQGQFSVNGQRTATNYFTVDGVGANFGLPNATTPYEGAGGAVPALSIQGGTSSLASVDAVQEFTIQTSTYAPEFGRQPGAQVAIVTRSGTNALHGSLFEYFRNDKLDANNWFANANRIQRPSLRQNDFGFTAGGPLFRNRTFFFVSYEGLRLIQPAISVPSRVPTVAARERATGLLKSLLEAYPLPVAAPLADASDETPYVAGFSNPSRLNATSFRIDHSISSRINVFGRYNHAPSQSEERGRFATPSFVAMLPGNNKTFTAGSTMMLSPELNNDLRFNWSRSFAAQIYRQDTFGGAKIFSPALVLPSFANPATSLFYLTIGGNDENTLSPGTFSANTQNQINIVDTATWTKGAHSLKFGFDYRRLSPSIGGRLYSKTLTIPTITQLITGIAPTAQIRQVETFLEPRYDNVSAFAQDAWRLNPRMTFTYGLRWEVNPAPSEANGNLPLTLRGLSNPGSAVLAPRGTRFYDTAYNNFAPRLGIAYQPFAARGTVVRAGFGVFYDLGSAFTGTAFSPGNYPYSRSLDLVNVPIGGAQLDAQAGPVNANPPYPRLFAYAEGYRLPLTMQYSFAVEQPFANANSLSVSYVGSASRRLARVESLRAQTLRNASFTRVDAVNNQGYSDYNSLQMQFKRRMTRGLQALLSYTWAKSLDTASDESITNLQSPAARVSPDSDRGPSSFDIRHAFTGSASYDIPVWRSNRAVRALLGGFALDSVVRLRTALPVTVVTGRDTLGLGLTNVSRPDYVSGTPLYLEGAALAGGRRFNPAAFNAAAPLAEGRQGSLGRGTLRGFGLAQTDLSIRRHFRVTERLGMDFRADAFNIFNTANFANPTGVMTSANFGRSTQILSSGLGGQNPLFQTGGPRSIQLGLKLQF